MNISKKTQYGLRAMVFLAKKYSKKELAPLKDVSGKEAIPFDFLEKIFSELEKAKLVKGKKGIGGGYILARNPNKITAKNIVEALEKTVPVDCLLCDKNKRCVSKNVWKKIENNINKTLNSIKLSDLIR